MENTEVSSASVKAVQGKLQELFEGLPDHEKPVLETLLAHAAGKPPGAAESWRRTIDHHRGWSVRAAEHPPQS